MDVKTYISDNVVRLLGSADSAIVDYVEQLATTSKTTADLYRALISNGVSEGPDAQSFANQLYSLVPRKIKTKAPKPSTSVAAQKFALLAEDDAAPRREKKRSKVKGKENDTASGKVKLERSSRKRDTEGNWDDAPEDLEEEEVDVKRARFESPHRDERSPEREETEEERREREAEEDRRERDAFAERMRNKDNDRTRGLVTDRTTRGEGGLEAERRAHLANDKEARKAEMENIRQHSRRAYLSKREEQQLDLLKLEIEDEKILFRNQKMSKRELAESERKKELIRIMEARRKIDDGMDGYMLPDDYITEQGKMDKKKRQNALYARYTENKPADGQFVTDTDQWEDRQREAASLRTGAMDKEFIEEEYEYVFDDAQKIEFLQDERMGGTLTKDAQDMMARIDELEKKGKSSTFGRRTLANYQPCLSRKSETLYPFSNIATIYCKPYSIIQFSSFQRRLDPVKPLKSPNTSTKQASPRTA
jgi:pre-mRNA-splicing factor ATP-dependent RNA helicase DHX16